MRSGIRPQKRLSQNFLRDSGVSQQIVECMSIQEGDVILEIGPGDGALTADLLQSCAEKIVAVEIDGRCIEYLKRCWGNTQRFFLIERDFLKFDLFGELQLPLKIRVTGNLPYAITSPILFWAFDQRRRIQDMTVMVQKEVAERIVAVPGTKTYGIPSVLFQWVSDVSILFSVSRNHFYPAPKVDSAVLCFKFLDSPRYAVKNETFFRNLVRQTFGQRRKMLRKSLLSLISDAGILNQIPIDLTRRPESLSVEEWICLSNALSQ